MQGSGLRNVRCGGSGHDVRLRVCSECYVLCLHHPDVPGTSCASSAMSFRLHLPDVLEKASAYKRWPTRSGPEGACLRVARCALGALWCAMCRRARRPQGSGEERVAENKFGDLVVFIVVLLVVLARSRTAWRLRTRRAAVERVRSSAVFWWPFAAVRRLPQGRGNSPSSNVQPPTCIGCYVPQLA